MKEKLKRKPEKVIKRKSYYGFSKKYPGACDRGTYLIGDSLTVKRKETAKKIIEINPGGWKGTASDMVMICKDFFNGKKTLK